MGVSSWPIGQSIHLEKACQYKLTKREPDSGCDGIKIGPIRGQAGPPSATFCWLTQLCRSPIISSVLLTLPFRSRLPSNARTKSIIAQSK